jgi:hypothetical protein
MQVGRHLQLEAVADPVASHHYDEQSDQALHWQPVRCSGLLSATGDGAALAPTGWLAILTLLLFIRLSQKLRLRVKLSGQPPS